VVFRQSVLRAEESLTVLALEGKGFFSAAILALHL